MCILSIISFFITLFIIIGERNKFSSKLTQDRFNIVRKNIENSRIAMYVFLGLSVFFGVLAKIITLLV